MRGRSTSSVGFSGSGVGRGVLDGAVLSLANRILSFDVNCCTHSLAFRIGIARGRTIDIDVRPFVHQGRTICK